VREEIGEVLNVAQNPVSVLMGSVRVTLATTQSAMDALPMGNAKDVNLSTSSIFT
jgi:hypothetical protein